LKADQGGGRPGSSVRQAAEQEIDSGIMGRST
jgi:hypothetical protein